jgi:hypothetical protein
MRIGTRAASKKLRTRPSVAAIYRADGTTEMKPVGEIEFVNGTSAMSASGQFGQNRLCAGIVV